MSPDVQTPPDLVSVAFVVEASVDILSEWRRILTEYIASILRRLAEAHSNNNGHRLRIAFVSYGSADTLPTPLLAKRFFNEYLQVVKAMKDPAEIGIGETNAGGSKGMAALEGLVAAVELFDQLKIQPQSKESARSPIHHLFHIYSSPPDDAIHPRWNVSSSLDNLTWDTLPSELKKRNIHFSTICLRSQVQRLSDLFAAASISGPTSPWFQVHSPHSVSLSGLTSLQPPKVTAKRPQEPPQAIDRPQEAKRPRLTDISPKIPSEKEPTNPPHAATPTTVTQPPPAATAPPHPPQPNMNQLMQRLLLLREHLRQLEMSIKTAENEGNKERVDTLKVEYKKNQEIYNKFTQVMALYNQRQQAEAHGQPATAMTRTQSTPVHIPKDSIPKTSSPSNDIMQIPPNLQQPQGIHNRTMSGSNIPPSIGNNTASNSQPLSSGNAKIPMPVEAQMRGLLDQRRHLTGGLGISPPVSNQNVPQPDAMPAMSSVGRPLGNSTTLPLNPPFQATDQAPSNGNNKIPVWQGTFTWSGTGPNGKKEIRAHFIATSNSPDCHAETWPENFTLVPTPHPLVEFSDLKDWMKRVKPVVCNFLPDPTRGEGTMNESYFRMLVTLLTQRRIYATAAWTLPSGAQETAIVIIPLNGLIGAVFPMTGVPEMPKSSNPPLPPPNTLSLQNINPQALAHLQQLPPEKRAQVLAQYMQQRQLQQAQNNAGQNQGNPMMMMPQGVNAVTTQPNVAPPQPHYGHMGGMPNIAGMQGGSNVMNFGPGHPNNIASGQTRPLGGGNMNYDLLQSFMHRNGDPTM